MESCFEGTNLILVTNREIYIHKKTEKGIIIEKPAGGVCQASDGNGQIKFAKMIKERSEC